jgi:ribosomal protein L37E
VSQLTKVRYDKSTTNFDPSEEKYWLHFLANDSKDPTVRDFIRSQLRVNPQYRRDVLNQVICARCERFAFHHKDGVQCTSCGHWSPNKTNKVKIHLAEGRYR